MYDSIGGEDVERGGVGGGRPGSFSHSLECDDPLRIFVNIHSIDLSIKTVIAFCENALKAWIRRVESRPLVGAATGLPDAEQEGIEASLVVATQRREEAGQDSVALIVVRGCEGVRIGVKEATKHCRVGQVGRAEEARVCALRMVNVRVVTDDRPQWEAVSRARPRRNRWVVSHKHEVQVSQDGKEDQRLVNAFHEQRDRQRVL
jgi:hypothetical protein